MCIWMVTHLVIHVHGHIKNFKFFQKEFNIQKERQTEQSKACSPFKHNRDRYRETILVTFRNEFKGHLCVTCLQTLASPLSIIYYKLLLLTLCERFIVPKEIDPHFLKGLLFPKRLFHIF